MEVKGTGLVTTRDFVKSRYPGQYDQWLNSLPEKSKSIYKGMIMNAGWYPLHDGYIVPINHIVKQFYHGDEARAGEELGIYSADVALKGLYKAFLLVATPNFLMTKASSMFTTYYKMCEVETVSSGSNEVTLTIKKFPQTSKAFEHRVGGWCKRALELSNCKGVRLRYLQYMSSGAPTTQMVLSWS
jgi:hypothetical protein